MPAVRYAKVIVTVELNKISIVGDDYAAAVNQALSKITIEPGQGAITSVSVERV